jgi:hypothetical protein
VVLIRTLSASVLLVVALTSCVAPNKVTEEKDANGNKIEYVYYTPTGSNVPIKVRKDQLVTADKDAAADNNMIEQAQRMPGAPPSQAANGPH